MQYKENRRLIQHERVIDRKTNTDKILQTNTEADDRWPESDSLDVLGSQKLLVCTEQEITQEKPTQSRIMHLLLCFKPVLGKLKHRV